MQVNKILVPYNFTGLDQKALGFVSGAFSHVRGVEVTILNVYTPIPTLPVKDNPVMKKMLGNINYLNQMIAQQEASLKEAREVLIANGFEPDGVRIDFVAKKKDIAGHIVDAAVQGRHDVIVLNRKSGRVSRFFTGSVFGRVVSSIKDAVVCIVS